MQSQEISCGGWKPGPKEGDVGHHVVRPDSAVLHGEASYPRPGVSFFQVFTEEWEDEEIVMGSLAVGKLTCSGPNLH